MRQVIALVLALSALCLCSCNRETGRSRQQQSLAYSGTLLEKGEGTNVLFTDSNVSFKAAKQPEKPDIIRPKQLKATIRQAPANPTANKQLDGIVELSGLTPQMPFSEAIDELKNSVEPPLKISPKWGDLSGAGIEPTTQINMDAISGISLGTALELLLGNVSAGIADLGYIVTKEGVIVIATKESLPTKLETRVYDVTDLVGRPAGF